MKQLKSLLLAIPLLACMTTPDAAAQTDSGDTRSFPHSVTVFLGMSSYGGERGRNDPSPAVDFVHNSGPAFGALATYPLSSTIHFGGRIDLMYLPTRFHRDSSLQPTLHRAESSAWSVQMLADASVMWPIDSGYSAGLGLGAGPVFSYLNSAIRPGLVVKPGARFEAPMGLDWQGVFHFDLAIVAPGTAIDLTRESKTRQGERNFDLVTSFRVGVRHRLWR